jgi:LysR family transcriptional activator of dmlA
LMPQFHTPDADIYAIYPAQHKSAARVRAFVDFVAEAFKTARTERAPRPPKI